MLADLQKTNARSLAEWVMCARDPVYLAERHALIKDKSGALKLMAPLRLSQRRLGALLKYCRDRQIPARIISGKSRKQGQSSWVEWDMFIQVMMYGYDGLVLAHDKESAEYIFGITDRFYKFFDHDMGGRVPALVKPKRFSTQNKRELKFADQEGLIQVETAGNLMAGTGKTPQYIHWSEVAKCESASDTAISLFQSIGDEVTTTFIMESTFNGEDTLFYPYWNDSYPYCKLNFEETGASLPTVHFEVTNKDKWNGWMPLFVPAHDDPDAYHEFADDEDRRRFVETLDAIEIHLLEKTSPEFLKWRRHTLKHKCQNNIAILKQEYPNTPEEAVRGSGKHRFNLDKLDMMPVEEPQLGNLVQEEGWRKRVVWQNDAGGIIRRYRTPVPGHRYVLSADAAEGIQRDEDRDPDATVVHVYDKDFGGEEVAVIEGQIHPEELLEPMVRLAEYFNMAFIVPESNSIGEALCMGLARIYPNERIYHRDDWNKDSTRRTRTLGFKTSPTNRKDLISYLGDAIESRTILFRDRDTVKECKKFMKGARGKFEAAPGFHDDHVIAAALGVEGMRNYPHRLDDEAMVARRLKSAVPRITFEVDPLTGY